MKLYTIMVVMTMLIFELCFKIVVGTALHPLNRDEHYMNHKQQFCGKRLSNELAILCEGEFYEVNGRSNRRQKRGIADECCSSPCSRSFIKMNYCRSLTEEFIYTSSPVLSPMEEVDYIGYYFELLGRVLKPITKELTSTPINH